MKSRSQVRTHRARHLAQGVLQLEDVRAPELQHVLLGLLRGADRVVEERRALLLDVRAEHVGDRAATA